MRLHMPQKSTVILIGILIAALILTNTDTAQAHTLNQNVCSNTKNSVYADALSKGASEDSARATAAARYARCTSWQGRHDLRHECEKPNRPLLPRSLTIKHSPTTKKQRMNMTRALNVARRMKVTRKITISLIMAITAESTGNNYPYGHASSVGILQLLNIHGSPKYSVDPAANKRWRMKISNSVGWYLRGALKLNTRGMTPGQIADAVERPRVRGGYAKWQREATRTYRLYMGRCL